MTEGGLGRRSDTSILIANCVIEELIGQGSTSQVYRARRYPKTRHHHAVALKYIDLSLPVYQYFPSQVDRFVHELELYHSLNSPYVIPLLESEYKPGSHIAMVMQLVSGPTLKETLKDGAWHIWHALSLCRRLGRVLTDLHTKQVIHKDVQAANVMLVKPFDQRKLGLPHVYLLDFGLSQRLPDTGKSASFDARPDIYGLARLIQHILWPNDETPYPDSRRGISEQFVKVLDDATWSEACFQTIEEFEFALLTAQASVADFLKSELRQLGQSGFDSEILDIYAYLDKSTAKPVLPIIPETQYLSESPTEPTKPYPALQDHSDAQPAPYSPLPIAKNQATTAVDLPLQPLPQRVSTPRRLFMSSLFSVGLIVGAVGLFIAYLQISAPLPPLDAPVWGIQEGYVVLLHPESRALLKSFTEYPASVSDFSDNGQYLLAERTVIDLRTGRPVMTFHHAPAPKAVALSDTGKLAALHDGQTLSVWEVETGRCLQELTEIATNEVADIFSPAGIQRMQLALVEAR